MKRSRGLLLIVGIVQIILLGLFTPPGEDISIARESFLTDQKTDFLGVFAGIFYASIPEFILGWQFYLAVLQCLLVLLALNLNLGGISCNRRTLFVFVITQTICLTFAAQQSRDGSLFAFTLLGLTIIHKSICVKQKRFNFFLTFFGIMLLLIGLSFRPWFALPVIPLLYFLKTRNNGSSFVSRIQMILISILILLAPLFVEFSVAKFANAEKNFPLQLLVINDLSAMSCWSSNSQTINDATTSLEVISIDPNFATRICQYFKPSSWQSIVGSFPLTNLTEGLVPPLQTTTNEQDYRHLVGDWIRLVIQDPKTFIQIKLMLSWQVIFASQSQLHPVPNQTLNDFGDNVIVGFLALLHWIFTLPWKIVSQLFLASPGVFLAIILYLFRYSQIFRSSTRFRRAIISCVILTVGLGTMTFVSDNGRYTTPFVMLCAVLIVGKFGRTRADRE